METNVIYNEDCLIGLKKLPDNSIDCCISSPPYWGHRDYGVDGQIGNENEFKEFVSKLIEIYQEVYRVLKPKGTCFVNLGDTYGGSESGTTLNKSLLMIPERFAIEMINTNYVLKDNLTNDEKNYVISELIKRNIL